MWNSVILVIIVSIFFGWFHIIRIRKIRQQTEQVEKLLLLNADLGLEKNASDLLEMVEKIIPAPIYMFYVMDLPSKKFLLKSVRYLYGDFGHVGPSYSGLVAYKKAPYQPPISLPNHVYPDQINIVQEDGDSLLSVPIPGEQGLIRIGAINRLSKKDKTKLASFAASIETILANLIVVENTKNQYLFSETKNQAISRIAEMIVDPVYLANLVRNKIKYAFHASAVLYVEPSHRGFDDCNLLLGNSTETMIKRKDSVYAALPTQLLSQDAEVVVLARAGSNSNHPILWIQFEDDRSTHLLQQSSLFLLHSIATRLHEVLQCQLSIRYHSVDHTRFLKALVNLMDQLIPYTVGNSEQMSRYSMIIAKRLGMSEEEIREVGLAAYLSNIAVLCLPSEIQYKEGKYSEREFEFMKQHAEIGADIVGMLLGNERLAAYIRHHHERMDGQGYPNGLKNEEIPIGARIIAVVQTFLAKVNGRKYREALSFESARNGLIEASGTQLDTELVDILIEWYLDKQKKTQNLGRSLGSCSEMCCTPTEICQKCPAYRRTDMNCWEVEGNLCRAHGKFCNTCFVKTEIKTRLFI